VSFKEKFITEGVKANAETQRFVKLMQSDEFFFAYMRDDIMLHANGDLKRQAKKIEKTMKDIFDIDDLNVSKVQDSYVYAQLERGKVDLTKSIN
jgi:hypothetical protein